MNDQDALRELWGGLVWGDCVGRIHRGWSAERMDEALGTQFFQSLTSVNGERLDWSPEFRAVEPAQRRAFVELGLYGHSTQLALFTGSVLATETEPDLWAGIENAMDADAFRVPNVEFVPVMYRLCRRGECVGQHWHHLFFPTFFFFFFLLFSLEAYPFICVCCCCIIVRRDISRDA